MGFHGISVGSLIIIFFIAVLLFGTKRLRTMAEDLGVAVRNFNRALQGKKSKQVQPDEVKAEIVSNDTP